MEGGGDTGRPWWASADAEGGRGHPAGRGRPAAPPEGHAQGEVCHLCPLCAVLRAVEEARPDVLAHLTEAARHLTQALKAVVDAQAGGFRPPREPFERIDVEGD